MIKGFVFDLDGVITDTAKFHFHAWEQLAKEKLAIDIPAELNESLKGVSRLDSLEIILKYAHKEDQFSTAEKEALANEKNNIYTRLIAQMDQNDLLPGMKRFLNEIIEKNYAISLASASRNAPRILKNLKLDDMFQKVVNPDELNHGKPNPEIFIKAARLIDSPVQQTVGIEDSIAGIEGIKAAGMFPVGIGPADKLPEAELNFDTTKDISLSKIETAFQLWTER